MPISDQHQAIFVHIPKTAGSSIEKSLGIYGTKNDGSLLLDEKILFGIQKFKLGPVRKEKAFQHFTATEIKKRVGEERFKSYFKFAFIRNPYDRAVSDWFHMKKIYGEQLSFKGYLVECVAKARKKWLQWSLFDDHFSEQHTYIYDENKNLQVDYLARFESLVSDWKEICGRIGIENNLPDINKGSRRDYKEYFDEETKSLTEKIFWQRHQNF